MILGGNCPTSPYPLGPRFRRPCLVFLRIGASRACVIRSVETEVWKSKVCYLAFLEKCCLAWINFLPSEISEFITTYFHKNKIPNPEFSWIFEQSKESELTIGFSWKYVVSISKYYLLVFHQMVFWIFGGQPSRLPFPSLFLGFINSKFLS